ncbi:uncharacterized protein TRIVIDRAFT_111149 [Trichoderma virens Gv29-8]|uniref:C2H2-type domain-containing protein n=1 Tax=Hypocrea virens (strain Gv29-8 / FGSC 10586) TaxID=413071 RepID=G9MN26_HYPVG|nr:uncharacterized protein TRIVIDRAFT_111149 [Trichoderma virens Gv29-8]EHK23319.1 hypothetical protein TRIVIDRAFT_111149 [Trichoderma virens Gv29-8]
MDWAWCQNPELTSILDDNINLGLFMDPALPGDNYFDGLLAAAGNHDSLLPNFLNTEECVVDDNDGFSLQLNSDQFTPPINAFQYAGIDSSIEAVSENQGAWDAATTPSAWSSSNTPFSPTDNFLSVSPHIVYQFPDMPSHIDSQTEVIGFSAPICLMNQPIIPTDIQKGKKPKTLKKDARKACKPEICKVCGKGHAEKRDLDRHMVAHHRPVAKRLGIDVSKRACKICGIEFDNIRRDNLRRHMKRKHPNAS